MKSDNDEIQIDNGQEEHDIWGESDTGRKCCRVESKKKQISKK